MTYMLMSTNCASKRLRISKKLLLCGSCVKEEHPEIFSQFTTGRIALLVCMEETHMNMVGLKLFDMFDMVKPEEVVVLTPDGSPHCVQLHYVVEDVKKRLRLDGLRVEHYVVDRGKIYKVSAESVKVSRYLRKIEKLLRK